METRLREPNNDRRGRVFSRRLQDPLLAAFVTAVIYWTVMLLGKYVPFGINTPAVTDAKLQYLDLFAYYRDVLTGQNSAVFPFSTTLGGGAAAIWAYYLAIGGGRRVGRRVLGPDGYQKNAGSDRPIGYSGIGGGFSCGADSLWLVGSCPRRAWSARDRGSKVGDADS